MDADSVTRWFHVPQQKLTGSSASLSRSRLWVLAILLIVTALPRIGFLGNPDYHVDEEFYALVADRMWHGALPYVDIWDRKPIGLFLIYATLRPLNGDSLIAVQIAGLLSSTGTAYVTWLIARRYANSLTALATALLYPCWMIVFGGANGQSPVFYNLLVVTAVLLVLRTIDTPESIRRHGLVAMLLGGLAIQIKYTAVFEISFLGLTLALIAVRTMPVRQAAAWIIAWASLALSPTLLAWLTYVTLGHGAEFVQANFTSIFLRGRLEESYQSSLIRFIMIVGLPMFGMALIGGLRLARNSSIPLSDRIFLISWAAAALVGFSCIGNFYDHYTLPLIAPLAILALPLFYNHQTGAPILCLILIWISMFSPSNTILATRQSRATISALATDVKPFLDHGSMFIWDGPSALYVASQATPPSRFAYPDHLDNVVEATALGVDTKAEMRRVLAHRPAVIVTSDRRIVPIYNPATRRLVHKALVEGYVEFSRRKEGWGIRSYIINVRRDLCRCAGRPNSQLIY